MRMTQHPIIQAVAGLGFGGFCLWLTLRQTDLEALAEVTAVIEPGWIVVAMVYYALDLALRVARWRLLLRPAAALGYRQVGAALITGYAVNNLLPARLGELFRADFMRRHFQVRRSAALGTILVERLLDGLALVLALNLGLLLSAHATGSRDVLLTVATLATAGLVAVFAVAWHFEGLRRRLEGRGWPWLQSRLRIFGETLAPLRGPDIWRPAVFTVVIYSLEALAIDAALRAAGIGIGPGALLVVMGTVSFSTLVPTAPGYVGSYQLAFIVSLQLFACQAPRAIVAATMVQVFLLGGVVAAGLATLFFINLRALAAGHGVDD